MTERSGSRPRGLPRLFLTCLAVLLIALALNGGLTHAALRAVHFEALSTEMRMVGEEWARRIQSAIRFGKPIEQFYGLEATLAEVAGDLPHAALVAVTLPDGTVVGAAGGKPRTEGLAAAVTGSLAASALNADARRTTSNAPHYSDGIHYFVFPVLGRDGRWAGALVLAASEETITAALAPPLRHNLYRLVTIAAAAAIALLVGLAVLAPLRPDRPPSPWRLYGLPIAVLALGQATYSVGSVQTFAEQYETTTVGVATRAAERLTRDLDRLLAKGVRLEAVSGLDTVLLRVMDKSPDVAFMEVRTANDQVLRRTYRDGRSETGAVTPPDPPGTAVVAPLHRNGAEVGSLHLHLSADTLSAGVRQRALDAGTVALTSWLFAAEMLIVLTLLLRSQGAREDRQAVSDDADRRHMLARPAAFLLLFAWALPLSFIPLRMRDLPPSISGLPIDLLLAIPTSAEMLCALAATFVAGAWADRDGWHRPFLAGIAFSVGGAALSAVAGDGATFIAARAVVGLGYGLAWMGIQSFIFLWAKPQARAQGLSNLVAGIFAGHISGSAVGAMLAGQIGHAAVFAISAVLVAAPAIFVLGFMRPFLGRPPQSAGMRAPSDGSWRRLPALVRDRDFLWLLLGSVVPFSVMQVGLLYYTLPLHLTEQGASQADIGRIMMIYGLTVIYLGPLLGRHVDRIGREKLFITAGGLVGSAGLIQLWFDHSVMALGVAVFLVALASCLGGAAQSAFALRLPAVRSHGSGKAMAVQRAADKLGQMLGPLVFGALFASVGAGAGLAVAGLFYLVATLGFAVLTREPAAEVSAA